MSTITLGTNVRVSDPCYDDEVWCKTKLTNVLPGTYNVDVEKSDQGSWGNRISILQAVHTDYVGHNLIWDDSGSIGVDSGQAGIFCESSYRNDSIDIKTPGTDFVLPYNDKPGDAWYEKMCKFTLCDNQWGSYETGVVSSTGFGDGMYPVDIARDKSGYIVGIKIIFIADDEEEEEDEYDTCPECGGEMDFGNDICDSCQMDKDES